MSFPNELGEVIGAGGFGVVRELKGSPYVVKLMRPHVCHHDAKLEYDAHVAIYNTYEKLLKNRPEFRNTIYIPKPIAFHTCSSLEECYGQPSSSCAYVMETVQSGRPDKLQEHLMFSNMYSSLQDKIYCKNRGQFFDIDHMLSEEERTSCEPRGAFLGAESIQKRLDPEIFRNLPYLFGILHGIVLKAGYFPVDVELVVDNKGRIAMYDFGMVYDKSQKEYQTTLEMDMYVPSEDQIEEFQQFQKGVQTVLDTFKTNSSGGKRTRRKRSRKMKKMRKTYKV
jgi:hypothetical protein